MNEGSQSLIKDVKRLLDEYDADDIWTFVAKSQLEDWAKMAEDFDGTHPDDIEFWSGMKAACDWILKHNFHVG